METNKKGFYILDSLGLDSLGLVTNLPCSLAPLLAVLVGQQDGRVQQLVLGHEPVLPGEAVPVQGPQQGPVTYAFRHFFGAQDIIFPRLTRAEMAA